MSLILLFIPLSLVGGVPLHPRSVFLFPSYVLIYYCTHPCGVSYLSTGSTTVLDDDLFILNPSIFNRPYFALCFTFPFAPIQGLFARGQKRSHRRIYRTHRG